MHSVNAELFGITEQLRKKGERNGQKERIFIQFEKGNRDLRS